MTPLEAYEAAAAAAERAILAASGAPNAEAERERDAAVNRLAEAYRACEAERREMERQRKQIDLKEVRR